MKTAFNLFSMTGGVALGCGRYYQTVAYTAFMEAHRNRLEDLMADGHLPPGGKIHRFAYNVGRLTVAGLRCQVVIAYVKPGIMQLREHQQPHSDGLFPAVAVQEKGALIIKKALYEVVAVAKVVEASTLILFLAESPLTELGILKDAGFVVTVWQVAVQDALLAPLPYVWCLKAERGGEGDGEVCRIPLKVRLLPGLPSKLPEEIAAGALMWDLAPSMVEQLLLIIEDTSWVAGKVYLTTEKSSGNFIDYSLVAPSQPFTLPSNHLLTGTKMAMLAGW